MGRGYSCCLYLKWSSHKKITNAIPYELWTRKKPDLNELKVWGSSTEVLIFSQLRRKLDDKSIKCTFIGYSENSKGYRFIKNHFDGSVNVIESRDAHFLEEQIDIRNPKKLVELFEIEKIRVLLIKP